MKSEKRNKFHFDNMYLDSPKPYESIILYQIGDLSCEGGYVIKEHTQLCYEISYIVSGCGYYYINGRSYQVKKGDVFLCLPGQHHYGIADTIDPFRYFYVGFNFDSSCSEQDPFLHIRKMFDQTKKTVVSDKFSIETPFMNILKELINLKDYGSYIIKTCLHQIIILAYRDFFDSWEKAYDPHEIMDKKKRIIYEIISYIDVNLCRIKELTQIADDLSYSYSHLSHVFSEEVGLTIKEYYNRKRFDKAIEWLKDVNYSVTEIAEKLQYQSIHTFSKAFRNNFGISPTMYRSLYIRKN